MLASFYISEPPPSVVALAVLASLLLLWSQYWGGSWWRGAFAGAFCGALIWGAVPLTCTGDMVELMVLGLGTMGAIGGAALGLVCGLAGRAARRQRESLKSSPNLDR